MRAVLKDQLVTPETNGAKEIAMHAAVKSQPTRPALWLKMSVRTGNLAQLGGIAAGSTLLATAAHLHTIGGPRIVAMLLGYLLIYNCSHAIGHYAVGRLVGIRFRGYGIRGTDHPENYPPGLRQLMSVLPFFTAMTVKESLRAAGPWAKAAMFSAGETATTTASLLAALYAWQSGMPGGWTLFAVTVIWDIMATITTAIYPRGDYTKARNALRVA